MPPFPDAAGFVEGFVYENTDITSPQNVVTTAVWQDEEAFQRGKKSAAEGFSMVNVFSRS